MVNLRSSHLNTGVGEGDDKKRVGAVNIDGREACKINVGFERDVNRYGNLPVAGQGEVEQLSAYTCFLILYHHLVHLTLGGVKSVLSPHLQHEVLHLFL